MEIRGGVAMGPTRMCTLPPGHFAPTVELKTKFMRPAKLGPLFATGRAVFKGKSIGSVEGTFRDSDGNMIGTASASARIVSPQPEEETS